MALQGDLLHVVDRDGLYTFAIDRATGTASPAGFVALGGEGSLLNDVCIGNDGTIYVTDTALDVATFTPTGADAIYRIRYGEVSTLLAGTHLQGPNGCYVDGANVYWTTFFSNRLYRTNPSGRVFTAATLPEGGIDSVVRVGGSFYLSSWDGSAVYRTSLGGSQGTQVASVETPGDMGYDARRHRLLVPSVFSADGSVHVVPLR
jgi:sugar lactone lactonase YvrE